MRLFVHDYETTCVNAKECGVVQACTGIVNVNEDGTFSIEHLTTKLLNPLCEIDPRASAVHGIYGSDVIEAEPYDEYLSKVYAEVNGTVDGICGYNSNTFDNAIAKRFGLDTSIAKVDLITATRKLKQKKLLSSAALGKAYEELTGNPAENAHDAQADVLMTLDLIPLCMGVLDIPTLTEFVDFLQSNINTMPFGKHLGKKFSDIPTSYLLWLKENTELSGELLANVNKELSNRNE